MTQTSPSSTALRVADLSQSGPTGFLLRPEKSVLEEIAKEFELLALRKLSFAGDITASGATDWLLSAKLGATVVQACAVTMEPVSTRIDVPVKRVYKQDYVETDAPEAEMPEDDTVEPIPKWIDPAAVMREALLLALPLYPRADGAELGAIAVSEPGVRPMTDEDARPFSVLSALKDQMRDKDSEED